MNPSQNTNTQTPPDYGQTLISWQAPEYEKQNKSGGWFVTAFIFGAFLIGASIIMRDYLLIIVVIMFGVVVYILHKKEPLMLHLALTKKGVKIGEKFYPYETLENFWIIYRPPIKTLNFKAKRYLFAEISIPLQNEDPLKIRDVLLDFLDEDEEKDEESTADKLTRILKI